MTYGDPPEIPPGRPGPAGNIPAPPSMRGISELPNEEARFDLIRRTPYIAAAQAAAGNPDVNLARISYGDYGIWSEWMAQPTQIRLAYYFEMASMIQAIPDQVADRTKRLLAWGMAHDDEVKNMLGRRGENNWFQVGNWLQSSVLADAVIPGDMNAVTSSEAERIRAAWEQNPEGMAGMAAVLSPENLDAIAATDPYFAAQRNVNFTGDEDYVDQDDGARPAEVSAHYQSVGQFVTNVFGDLMTAADWAMLAGVAGAATAGVRAASTAGVAAIPGLAVAGARRGLGSALGVLTGVTDRQLAAWHMSRMGRFLMRPGGRPELLREGWRTTGRTWAGVYAGSMLATTGVQAAYEQWIRDVTPADVRAQEQNEAAVREDVAAGLEEGSILPHRIISDSIARIRANAARYTTPTPVQTPTDPVQAMGAGTTPTPVAPGGSYAGAGTTPGATTTAPNLTAGQLQVSALDALQSEGLEGKIPALLPEYIGGMEDQFVRDADGNIDRFREGYTKQGGLLRTPWGTGRMEGRPQYRLGDTEKLLASMSPAQLHQLTSSLTAIGVDVGFVTGIGMLTTEVRNAFESLLTDANWNAVDWQTQLDSYVTSAKQQARDNADANRVRYARFSYLPPDYDTLAQGAKAQFRSQLGREPTPAEITLYGDAFTRVDRQSQRQTYDVERAQAENKAWREDQPTERVPVDIPVEDPTTGGIRPGGPTDRVLVDRPVPRPRSAAAAAGDRQVDVASSMAEWFEREYGPEVDIRDAMNQAATNFATALSGSEAITQRVRQG